MKQQFVIIFFLALSLNFIKAQGNFPQSVEFCVTTNPSANQRRPAIATFGDNRFVVCWAEYGINNLNTGIYCQIFSPDGDKLCEPLLVNTEEINQNSRPAVSTFSDNRFIVSWASNNVYGQIFDETGLKLGDEFRVNKNTEANKWGGPSVSTFSDGRFIISWSGSKGIYYQLFDERYNKISCEVKVNADTISKEIIFPSVSILTDNRFALFWTCTSFDNNCYYKIYGQLFNTQGIRIGPRFPLSKNQCNEFESSIATFPDDHFVVCWASGIIYGQLFDVNGGKVGKGFLFLCDRQPSVGSFKNGRFIVSGISRREDPFGWDVYWQFFDEHGQKVSNKFCAENNTKSWHWYPSVSTFLNGRFVVCWENSYSDTSMAYISGNIYPARSNQYNFKTFRILHPTTDSIISTTAPRIIWQSARDFPAVYPWEFEYFVQWDTNDQFKNAHTLPANQDTSIVLPGLEPGTTYFCRVLTKNAYGDSLWSSNVVGFLVSHTTEVDKQPACPEDFILQENYPNPFNPETRISYQLPTAGHVALKIYDLTGRLVKVLVNQNQQPGAHSITWDGTDMHGAKVAAGIYIYRLGFTVEDGRKWVRNKKMSLVR